jgi:hypothetical protein
MDKQGDEYHSVLLDQMKYQHDYQLLLNCNFDIEFVVVKTFDNKIQEEVMIDGPIKEL